MGHLFQILWLTIITTICMFECFTVDMSYKWQRWMKSKKCGRTLTKRGGGLTSKPDFNSKYFCFVFGLGKINETCLIFRGEKTIQKKTRFFFWWNPPFHLKKSFLFLFLFFLQQHKNKLLLKFSNITFALVNCQKCDETHNT